MHDTTPNVVVIGNPGVAYDIAQPSYAGPWTTRHYLGLTVALVILVLLVVAVIAARGR